MPGTCIGSLPQVALTVAAQRNNCRIKMKQNKKLAPGPILRDSDLIVLGVLSECQNLQKFQMIPVCSQG